VLEELRQSEVPPLVKQFLRDLGIGALERKARRQDWKGTTARRLLATVFADTSFYLTRDLLEQKRWNHAAAALGVATAIRPEDPGPWYNLACAYSSMGRVDDAVEALAKACASGRLRRELPENDPDLEAVRDHPGYRRLVESLSPP